MTATEAALDSFDPFTYGDQRWSKVEKGGERWWKVVEGGGDGGGKENGVRRGEVV